MEHPRLHLHEFLSSDLCKELEFIHRSCGAVGYRPNVLSTTLSHLAATNCGHLILPFVSIREKLKEKVEDFFGCQFELFIEFTALISWCKGASIGWHSDDNRPYLKQREFAVVCYLNSHGKEFEGGVFRFKKGDPAAIVPTAGDVLIYTADDRNVHSVDEVRAGERVTLTLWFTRNRAEDEDAKLISLLSQRLSCHNMGKPHTFLPLPASDNMYWFSDGVSGFDIRCARIQTLGFKVYSSKHREFIANDISSNHLELLNMPIRLGRGDEIFEKEFLNSLHGLQVVQFFYLKSSELMASISEHSEDIELAQSCLAETSNGSDFLLFGDNQIIEKETLFPFNWAAFQLAVNRWEEYMCSLYEELLVLFPLWCSHQAIFSSQCS